MIRSRVTSGEYRTILGIASLGHDASCTLVDDNRILFAAHAERYSRIKNDGLINTDTIADALRYGTPEAIVWYEKPISKRSRMLWAGQPGALTGTTVGQHLQELGHGHLPVHFVGHHESHAAGGFFTSPFNEAAILVVDAIGEWDTASLWVGNVHGKHSARLRKIWSQKYPHSLGLFYSAMTQRCGFKPNEEEYILMGMSALGKPILVDEIRSDLIINRPAPEFRLKVNCHKGLRGWRPEHGNVQDIAASAQKITEEYLVELAQWARKKTGLSDLVLSGGVALNCVANTRIARESGFDRIWIMPNTGDAGSSLGAVAAYQRKKLDWQGPYLGHDVSGILPIESVIQALLQGEVVGIVHGRAEFGPRALGHRSLLLDPRLLDGKDRMNRVKGREPFRPFAPAVLSEHANEHFDMPVRETAYMQYVVPVLERGRFPAIEHVDGTARVQTVSGSESPDFRRLLEAWYATTGCPMLLNTSLNVKGEPLVNDIEDAARFARVTGVKVITP